MSAVCEPVDWQIFNAPSVEPVEYYLILKKKREFSQLVKDYDTEISKQSYVHYSCIVPRYSYLNSSEEMFILLFDGMSSASFIGLRMKVNSKNLVHESNFLLHFLKKLEEKILYHVKENYVLIQCETADVWELFYLLYNMYLRQYMLTIIGTNFFNFYIYSSSIKKDIQLLQMLYNGSKIIKISKKSVFYKLLHETKISVSHLVHVLTNMPKGTAFNASNFNFKVSPSLSSESSDWKYYLPFNRKMISKLKQKKVMKRLNLDSSSPSGVSKLHENIFSSLSCQYESPKLIEVSNIYKYSKEHFRHSVPTKRKFEEVDNTSSNSEIFTAPSKCSKILSNFAENSHWEEYCNIKSFPVNRYSDIPSIHSLLPKLLNVSENCNLNFDINQKENSYLQKEHSPKCDNITCLENLPEKCTYELTNINSQNIKSYCDNFVKMSRNSIYEALSFVKPSQLDNLENRKFSEINNSETVSHKINILSHTDAVKDNSFDDVDFMTASGKTINVSNAAMLTASKMLKDVFVDELHQSNGTANFIVGQNKVTKNTKPFKNSILSNSSSRGLHDESFQLASNIDITDSNRTVKNTYIDPPNNSGIDSMENLDFTTAAGKIVCVSSSSIQAANKILQDVLNEINVTKEINTHHGNISTEQHISTVVGGSSKFVSHEIDKMEMDGKLVEHFFTQSPFDMCDTNSEVPMECNSVKNINMEKEECNTMKSAIQKPRKSLGGRRSKRYTNML